MLPVTKVLRPAALVYLTASAAACAAEVPRLDTTRGAIVGGAPDEMRRAVVALLTGTFGDDLSVCTGTLIHTTGRVGVVLTAAHCVHEGDPPVPMAPERLRVILGGDYTRPERVYPVVAIEPHPGWTGSSLSPHDFALVRVAGVDATTPVLAVLQAAADDLAEGDAVERVGFGRTDEGSNAVRRSITSPIKGLTEHFLAFDHADGGTCFGDSGGPGLIERDGPRVAAVTSHGGTTCTSSGVSGRIAPAEADWVRPYVASTEGALDCATCVRAATIDPGICGPEPDDCGADPTCARCVCEAPCAEECEAECPVWLPPPDPASCRASRPQPAAPFMVLIAGLGLASAAVRWKGRGGHP